MTHYGPLRLERFRCVRVLTAFLSQKGTTWDTEITYEIDPNAVAIGGQVLLACFCHSKGHFPSIICHIGLGRPVTGRAKEVGCAR